MPEHIAITISSEWRKVDEEGNSKFGELPASSMMMTFRFADPADAAEFQEVIPKVMGLLLEKAKQHKANIDPPADKVINRPVKP